MAGAVLCKICGRRRARRTCPAVEGEICAICCGTEREVSLACPLECAYLQEAHRREKPRPLSPQEVPNADIEVSEEFIHGHEELLLFCTYALVNAATRTPGAVDRDALEALDAEIRTQRTAQSGLLYASKPENFVAQGVQRLFTASLADFEKERQKQNALTAVRSSDLLKVMVFLQRVGVTTMSERPRGRVFLDLMRQMAGPALAEQQAERSSGIIIGGGH